MRGGPLGWGRQSAARPQRRQHPSPAELAVQLGQAARPAERGCQKTPLVLRRPVARAPNEVACLIRGGPPSLTRVQGRAQGARPRPGQGARVPRLRRLACTPRFRSDAWSLSVHSANFCRSFLHAVIWLICAARRVDIPGGRGTDITLSLVPLVAHIRSSLHIAVNYPLTLRAECCCSEPTTRDAD